MFFDHSSKASAQGYWNYRPTGLRLQPVSSRVKRKERERIYGYSPHKLLTTGISAFGKKTLALELQRQLFYAGKQCVLLDGQDMRFGLSHDLGFSAEERSENPRRPAEIAKKIKDAGLIYIAAFVAPHREYADVYGKLSGKSVSCICI